MPTQFSLAYSCACAFAYAYAVVNTRLNQHEGVEVRGSFLWCPLQGGSGQNEYPFHSGV